MCCCGPCALVGAGVCFVVRCSLPLPPPFVFLLVVLRVPAGAVLAAVLFPLPLLVLRVVVRVVLLAPPSGALRRDFFTLLVGCVLVVHPPPAGCGVLCCALSCVASCDAASCGVLCVVPGVVWRACVGLEIQDVILPNQKMCSKEGLQTSNAGLNTTLESFINKGNECIVKRDIVNQKPFLLAEVAP